MKTIAIVFAVISILLVIVILVMILFAWVFGSEKVGDAMEKSIQSDLDDYQTRGQIK